MHSLSVAIITFNEERNIRRCLESLSGVADEIVVVDSFSTDATEAICKEFGTRFIKHPFEGHIEQKNFALQQCTNNYVLSLDADEAIDSKLQNAIVEVKKSGEADGYKMNRLTNYCGHWVRHCGWYPDTKVRLVNKNKASWQGINPHDRLDLHNASPATHLEGDILHYSYYTREDHLKQIEFFSSIASKELFKKRKNISQAMIIIKIIAQFVKSYIIKAGFLDGGTGFTISCLSAYATYKKYSKLKRLYAQERK
ncbi:MAG: glycosyltransferase family 2 protein [Crocinitomicaceae bacterium]|nr:glycosyltransferase family 2 protein [Crocinitomicaceae bacterium]